MGEGINEYKEMRRDMMEESLASLKGEGGDQWEQPAGRVHGLCA